jgi:hypothetical protein
MQESAMAGHLTNLTLLGRSLARLNRHEFPYPHANAQDVFDEDVRRALCDELDQCPWRRQQDKLQRLSSCWEIAAHLVSTPAAWMVEQPAIDLMRTHLARIFRKSMEPRWEVIAHRMEPGDWIGAHNDAPVGGRRTHRLTFILGGSPGEGRGGELMLIGPDATGTEREIAAARENSAIALEFSRESFHRVQVVESGVRYSLVYAFWSNGPASVGTATARIP